MPATAPDETNELLEAAINTGDVDAALALHEPEDCLVATPGEPVFGLDAIRVVLQGFVDAKPTLTREPSAVLQVGDLALTAHAWKAAGTVPTARSNSPATRPKSCAHRRTARGVSSSTIPTAGRRTRPTSRPGRGGQRPPRRTSVVNMGPQMSCRSERVDAARPVGIWSACWRAWRRDAVSCQVGGGRSDVTRW